MKQQQEGCKRIVIKIGSSLFYRDKKALDLELIGRLAAEISFLLKNKNEVLVVSSGAIALGMSVLGLESRPKDIAHLQAAAAVGQNELMGMYRRFFKELGINCAQVLLTWDDFSDRRRYLNAKNTLLTLLRIGSVPIINENDTVSIDEIKFGDNDRLSALVASLVGADLLIILSDVDGLLDKDKKTLIKVVDKITPQIKAMASSSRSKTSVGGMITKIEAAKIAVDSGIPCVIANGRHKGVILAAAADPAAAGTLFIPRKGYLAARKRWIAFGSKPKGNIIVDDGARQALLNKKSLLCVGVVSLDGTFDCGDVVSIVDGGKCVFARGRVSLSSRQLDKVKGGRFDKEIVHRDNIVIL